MKNKRMNSWLTIVAIGVATIVGTAGPMALDGYAQTTTTNVLVRTETLLVLGERLVVITKSIGTVQVGDCAPEGEYSVQGTTAIDREGNDEIDIIPLLGGVGDRFKKGTVIRIVTLQTICNDGTYLYYNVEVLKKKVKKHTHPPATTECVEDDEPEQD